MTKLYWPSWANEHRVWIFLTALLIAGFGQRSLAIAQSLENDLQVPPGMQLVPGGSAFGPGGIPTSHTSGLDGEFIPSARYGLTINPDAYAQESPSQYWLEFSGTPRAGSGMNARIGLGYSPSPDLGFSMGPFLDLDVAAPGTIGVYQTDQFGGRHPLHPGFALGDNAVTNDAGLAGSLSYMPLEDIWIGLHGSVSRDLTSTNRKDGFLDGIDAMLGLTASYRIQF